MGIVDGAGLPVGPPWDDRAAALGQMGALAAGARCRSQHLSRVGLAHW